MKKFVLAALCGGFLMGGSAFAADKPEKPKMDKEAQFKKMDTNSDKKLSKEEFLAKVKPENKAKAEERMTKMDKDKDGSISMEEFMATPKKPATPKTPK